MLFLLGTPHTGESVAELADLATETGVRLICPTRSWYVDTAVDPSFEACTADIIRHFSECRIAHAYVIGGSGGGPFELHALQPSLRRCNVVVSRHLLPDTNQADSIRALLSPLRTKALGC